MYIRIHICVYIDTCVYIHIYIHTYIYIYIRMYVYIHMCTCVYIYIYIYINKYTPTNACIDTQTRVWGHVAGEVCDAKLFEGRSQRSGSGSSCLRRSGDELWQLRLWARSCRSGHRIFNIAFGLPPLRQVTATRITTLHVHVDP